MNTLEKLQMQRAIADLTERLESMERLLGLLEPEPIDADNASVEGAQMDTEDEPEEGVPYREDDEVKVKPIFEGVQDLGGGWFNVYWGGAKINSKALRKDAAEQLLDSQRATMHPDSQPGATV